MASLQKCDVIDIYGISAKNYGSVSATEYKINKGNC